MHPRCVAIAALAFVSLLEGCAPVHDATPAACPADQTPSAGLCLCMSTLEPPVEGNCPRGESTMCSIADCGDDGNPCTEPTCLPAADTCTNEAVVDLTICAVDGATGTCTSGSCVVEDESEWILGEAFMIGGEGGTIAHPVVTVRPDGTATAVWIEGTALMAARLDPEEGWGVPRVIDEGVNPERTLSIASGLNGETIALYVRIELGSIDVRAARYDPALDVWEPPFVISRPGAVAAGPRIAFASDAAVATWWEAPGETFFSRAALGEVVLNWSDPQAVSLGPELDEANHALSIGDDGRGAVIYRKKSSTGEARSVWVTPVGPSDAVAAPVAVNASTSVVTSVDVAVQDDEIMAVWEQGDDIWHAHFSDAGWTPAGLLETSGSSAFSQEVEPLPGGDFLAVWSQGGDIRSRQFESDTDTWGDIEIIPSAYTARRPAVTSSPAGDIRIVWHTATRIRSRQFTPTDGWGGIRVLSPELQFDAEANQGPKIARGSEGTTVIVWADGPEVWAMVDRM